MKRAFLKLLSLSLAIGFTLFWLYVLDWLLWHFLPLSYFATLPDGIRISLALIGTGCGIGILIGSVRVTRNNYRELKKMFLEKAEGGTPYGGTRDNEEICRKCRDGASLIHGIARRRDDGIPMLVALDALEASRKAGEMASEAVDFMNRLTQVLYSDRTLTPDRVAADFYDECVKTLMGK
jgi:hypothetical protein